MPTWPQGRDQPPPSRAARRRWGSWAPWGGSGCGGGPFAPTACHTHPRWQAASQSSHPSLPCLTVLLLHLVELPEVGEQHFPRSSQLARAKLQIAQREGVNIHILRLQLLNIPPLQFLIKRTNSGVCNIIMFFFCKALQGRMCVFELGDEAKQKLQKVELKCYDDSVARRYAIFLCSLVVVI